MNRQDINASVSSKRPDFSVSKIEIKRIEKPARFQIKFQDAKRISLDSKNRQPQRICLLSQKFTRLDTIYKREKNSLNILGWNLDESRHYLAECDHLITKRVTTQESHKPFADKFKKMMDKEYFISRELINQPNKISDSYSFSKLHAKQTVFTAFNQKNLKHGTNIIQKKKELPISKPIEFNQVKFNQDLNELITCIINILIRLNLYNQKTITNLQLKSQIDSNYFLYLIRKNETITKFLNRFNYSNFLNDSDLSSGELKQHEIFINIHNSLSIQSELLISNDSLNDLNTNYMNKSLQLWLDYFEMAKIFYKHFIYLNILEEAKFSSFEFSLFQFVIEFKSFMLDFVRVLKLESLLEDESALSPIKVIINLDSCESHLNDPRKFFYKIDNKSFDFNLIKFNKKTSFKNESNETIETQRSNETLLKYKLKVDELKESNLELEKICDSLQSSTYLTPESSLNLTEISQTNENDQPIDDRLLNTIDLNDLMNIDFDSFEIGILKTSTQINQLNNVESIQALNNISNTQILNNHQTINLSNNGDQLATTCDKLSQVSNLNEQETFVSLSDSQQNQTESPINNDVQINQIIENSNETNHLVDIETFANDLNSQSINLNQLIGGKQIIKIIPRPEFELSFESSFEETNLITKPIEIQPGPSRNVLKSIIASGNDSSKSLDDFQLIKDSLKESAYRLNEKIKSNKEIPNKNVIKPIEDDDSRNKSLHHFDKKFEFNSNQTNTKLIRRSINFNNNQPIHNKVVINSIDKDDFINTKCRRFIKKARSEIK